MVYQTLGASLTKNDLFYALALVKSENLDLKTVLSAGAVTDAQMALITDKNNLVADVVEKLSPLVAANDPIITANASLYDQIGGYIAENNAKIAEVMKLTPTPAQNVTITQYMPNTPFVSPPVYPGDGALKPSDTTLTSLAVPLQTMKVFGRQGSAVIDITDTVKSGAAGISAAQAAQLQAGQGGKLPIGILAVAGVVAFLLLNK